MTIAIGMVQVKGYPSALQVADGMVKAAQVTVVSCESIGAAYWTVVIRGDVAEVNAAVAAGIDAVRSVHGGEVVSHQIIARPEGNLEPVLPINPDAAARLDDYLL
uniref:Carboxysome shell protein CcmK n=1 Tax=Cyanothece sp. (strain PCC 7425 / ATCC 29141) TaxID=395961 RepID=B8HUM1_CYAP4